jgi:uncharacterized protein
VGLSLDGYAEIHNKNRVDNIGAGTYSRVCNAKRLLESYKVDFNILTVLTREAARHPQKMWNFIEKEDISYIQFIPCLDKTDCGLSPGEFYGFYSGLFKTARSNGKYISVKLFEDIIDLFALGKAAACGMNGQCSPQFVVEADGSVYPCDFYCTDEFRLGNLKELSLRDAFESSAAKAFRQAKRKLPQACDNCRYLIACNGGCKRQFHAMCVDAKGFCGFKALLDECFRAGIQFLNTP